MKTLHVDIETYCEANLLKTGVYRYAQDPSFEIILFAYAWDDEEPTVVDLIPDGWVAIPDHVWTALDDPNVLKIAHNANFERVCLEAFLDMQLDPAQWFCTMVGAAYLGLPHSLDKVGQVLNLTHQKDSKGKALIAYFCTPCKPTKRNGGRTRNLPHHDPDKWELFKSYNAQDVRTESEVYKYLQRFPAMPAIEWEYWQQDQAINARGVQVDPEFIDAAIEANLQFLQHVHVELKELTGVDNPNSLAQLKAWIEGQGVKVVSLNKDSMLDLVAHPDLPDNVARVLYLRQLGSKTSVSKYDAMRAYMCEDGRIRGLLQFYGANRTGRFAGRGVQVQNLKRTMGKGLLVAREAVVKGVVDLLYDDVPEVISKLVRTALIASPGKSLVSVDFSAIEARVVAWLAGEEWQLEVFNTHGRLYEATAAKMFNLPLSSITKGSDLRQKGKVAALALGYQGGAGALVTMGALRQGLTEAELPAIVRAWRSANPAIVELWRQVEGHAKLVIERRSSCLMTLPYTYIRFSYERGYLFITLPSGRRLAYYGATVKDRKLYYYGVDQTRKIWTRIDTYGGSLVENIVQAIARDCLVDAMHRLKGCDIVMHVHDEIVLEVNDDAAKTVLTTVKEVMAYSPSWGVGLPLSGDGYISKYYKKD
jgi:DNA polymerase bacteriophage-type